MGIVLFGRHGEDRDNANGILNGSGRNEPLTDIGRGQAVELAKAIRKKYKVKRIIYSPLLRARDTAFIVARILKIRDSGIICEPLLTERNYGGFTGRKIEEIPDFPADFIQGPKYLFFLNGPGVETYPETQARALSLVSKHKSILADGTTLLIGHHDIGLIIYSVLTGIGWKEILENIFFENCGFLESRFPPSRK